MAPDELLKLNRIELQDTRPGRYYTTCPECSAKRKPAHQKQKCLGVTIEPDGGVRWGCNHQTDVTTTIGVARSVAQGDDALAAKVTVSLARRAGPDAVKFLRRVMVTDGGWATVAQRVRAACAVLEVAHYLGDPLSSESRAAGALEERKGTDGAGEREGT